MQIHPVRPMSSPSLVNETSRSLFEGMVRSISSRAVADHQNQQEYASNTENMNSDDVAASTLVETSPGSNDDAQSIDSGASQAVQSLSLVPEATAHNESPLDVSTLAETSSGSYVEAESNDNGAAKAVESSSSVPESAATLVLYDSHISASTQQETPSTESDADVQIINAGSSQPIVIPSPVPEAVAVHAEVDLQPNIADTDSTSQAVATPCNDDAPCSIKGVSESIVKSPAFPDAATNQSNALQVDATSPTKYRFDNLLQVCLEGVRMRSNVDPCIVIPSSDEKADQDHSNDLDLDSSMALDCTFEAMSATVEAEKIMNIWSSGND